MKNYYLDLKLLFYVLIIFFIISCSPYYQKLYEGPEQPYENLAFIIIDGSALNKCEFKIFAKSGNIQIDPSKIDYRYSSPMVTEPFAVLPGKYTVQINALENNIFKLVSRTSDTLRNADGKVLSINTNDHNERVGSIPCSVDFDIEAGKTFFVRTKITKKQEITTFNNLLKEGMIYESVYTTSPYSQYSPNAINPIPKDYLFTLETIVDDGAKTITSCIFDSKSGE